MPKSAVSVALDIRYVPLPETRKDAWEAAMDLLIGICAGAEGETYGVSIQSGVSVRGGGLCDYPIWAVERESEFVGGFDQAAK